jgi:myo-inositol-1(or 4)-monophosphatase
MIDISRLLDVAKTAALEAGEIQMSFFGKTKEIGHKMNEFDLVTNVDKASEEKILTEIGAHFPDHCFLGEEGGVHNGKDSDYLWIIDPLDGTTNYAHNFPHFAVSIALYYQNQPYLGVVYDPFKNEMFWAAEGAGAFLNAEPIQVSNIATLNKSLLATGFPYSREGVLEQNLEYFKKFLYKSQAIRRPGSAALDLCYVACGRYEGFWELNLSPWDVAAGVCIVREAGGKITNFGSEGFDYNVKNVLASNGLVHAGMAEVIEG